MKSNYLLALLVALVFVSCSKEETLVPVGASSTQNESGVLNKKDGYKEIEGKLTYNWTDAFDLSCNTCEDYDGSSNFLGSGNLEHLGKVSSKTKACVKLIISEGHFIGLHIYNQCCTFTAPNGDELKLTTDGYNLYWNANYTAFVGTCKFYFAGGTGKYKNASGSFTGDVVNSDNSFTVDLEGKLSY